MGFTSLLYNAVAKRTSTFVLAVGVSAFVFERGKIPSILTYLYEPPGYGISIPGPTAHTSLPRIILTAYHILGFDTFADFIWETNNKGKLWKDIKHKYEEAED